MPLNIPESSDPRIVIIGAGFAGFCLAKKLSGKGFQIVLLDRNNYHQFQPLYYQVAMSGLEPSSICFPLRRSFQNEKDFFVRVAEVSRIIPAQKQIESSMGIIRYDILVLAMGAKTNYYDNKNFERNTIPLKSVAESLFLRNCILRDLETAVMSSAGTDISPLLDIVIVGGGPTGVELAGALAEMKLHILPKDYPDLDSSQMNIHLVSSPDRLLANMSAPSSEKAKQYLIHLGVHLHLSQRVQKIDDGLVYLQNGEILKANKVIWAAGVVAATIPGIPSESITIGGRIEVNQFCQVLGDTNIYAIGDIACMKTDTYPEGHPQVAPGALQQATWLAAHLKSKGTNTIGFKYFDKGNMATVGRHKAVVDFKKYHFSGFVAWIVWLFVHIYYLIGVKNKLIVMLNWVWGYLFYDQALRLLITPKKETLDLD